MFLRQQLLHIPVLNIDHARSGTELASVVSYLTVLSV